MRTATVTLTRIADLLSREGYDGSYGAVRRYASRWADQRRDVSSPVEAFVPLSFAPGDAYQFDWSHDQVEIGGTPRTVKVAHLRLSHSRRFPEYRDRTVQEVFEAERPFLEPLVGPFDGFHQIEAVAQATCLINFDHNRCSLEARAARRAVQIRAYADRVVVLCDGEVVADQHPNSSARAAQAGSDHHLPGPGLAPPAHRRLRPLRLATRPWANWA